MESFVVWLCSIIMFVIFIYGVYIEIKCHMYKYSVDKIHNEYINKFKFVGDLKALDNFMNKIVGVNYTLQTKIDYDDDNNKIGNVYIIKVGYSVFQLECGDIICHNRRIFSTRTDNIFWIEL